MAARTKAKSNPYQPFIDTLRRKQHELLDSYQRDKAAGNALPDDGIQDLADKAASASIFRAFRSKPASDPMLL